MRTSAKPEDHGAPARSVPGISRVDAAALKTARAGLDAARKGRVTLQVVDAAGKPVRGALVEYRQVGHEFQFGIFLSAFDPEVVRLMREAGINATTLHVNWRLTQPEPGADRFDELSYRWGLRQLKAAGLTVKAHSVFWFKENVTPLHAQSASKKEFRVLWRKRQQAIVERFKETVDIWELVNEPMAPWANVRKMTAAELLAMLKANAKTIRKLDPTAKTLINFAAPAGRGYKGARPRPLEFPALCKKAGVKYDIIGLQLYYNAFTPTILFPKMSLAKQARLVNAFATAGKEVHVTELTVPSRPKPGLTANQTHYWSRPWSESLQADYLTVAYTVFFGNPAVTSISWWDATDAGFIYYGGLLDEQRRPKPAYYALKRLIARWTSAGVARTNADGRVTLRGFGGRYRATVRDPKTGRRLQTRFAVREHKKRTVKIVLDSRALAARAEAERKAIQKSVRASLAQIQSLLRYWRQKRDVHRVRYGEPLLASATDFARRDKLSEAEHRVSRALDLLAIPKSTVVPVKAMRNTLSVKRKGKNAGARALRGNNSLLFDKEFTGGKVRVELEARCEMAGGRPLRAAVFVGDIACGAFNVTHPQWRTYTVEMEVPAGKHEVVIRHVNEMRLEKGNARTLWVRQARVIEYIPHAP